VSFGSSSPTLIITTMLEDITGWNLLADQEIGQSISKGNLA
jgi:hypothetical protein